MSLRVVLYAEGRGETRGAFATDPEPGIPIPAGHLGAGPALVGRVIGPIAGVPSNAVVFEGPLRPDARSVVGSDLLNEKRLQNLVLGAVGTRAPDLIVFLIDDDGKNRYSAFATLVANIRSSISRVTAVAIQEFETWLLADSKAASSAVRSPVDEPRDLESLEPREAKRILREWTGDEHARMHRIEIARTIDLERLRKRCASFQRFESDLRRVFAQRKSSP